MIITRCQAVQGVWKHDGGGRPGMTMYYTESWEKFLKANDFPHRSARLYQVILINNPLNYSNLIKTNLPRTTKSKYFTHQSLCFLGGAFRNAREARCSRRVDPVQSGSAGLDSGRKRRGYQPYQLPRLQPESLVGGDRNETPSDLRIEDNSKGQAMRFLRSKRLETSSTQFLF